jgi:hypothetical protein
LEGEGARPSFAAPRLSTAHSRLTAAAPQESEERGVTVLMSTHIFDGLESWGTHIAMVAGATVPLASPTPEVEGLRRLRDAGHPAPLFAFVEAALRAEKSRVALSAESVLRPDAN